MHKLQGSAWRSLITLAVFFSATFAWCETPLSDPLFARGAGWQTTPVAASNGRDFLLVWIDARSGAEAIYATRVAADGSVLDPEGILVSAPDQRAFEPSVAWVGNSWIVAWSGDRCQFRRIAADGRPDGSAQAIFGGSCRSPRVAASGETAIIAAYEAYVGVQVATIENTWPAVRPLGKVLGAPFDVACSRSDCVLAWLSYPRKLMARRIGPRGEHFDNEDRLLTTDAIAPAIAATDDRFLLTWRDSGLFGVSSHIFARELDAQSESAPFVVTESLQSPISDSVVSPSGRGFLVAWKQNREVVDRPGLRAEETSRIRTPQIELHARRVADSYEEDWAVAPSNVSYWAGAIASNGTTHLGAWIERSNGKIAANIARNGASLSRIAVTRTATEQSDPQVVKCGDHLLVVWSEEVRGDGRFAVMARRFRMSGEAIDAAPIAIANSIENQRRPAAAFDGTSYMIAWSEDRHVYARRLHGDGTFASDALALTSEGVAGAAPKIAATDRGFAVLYGEGDDLRRRLILTLIGPGPSLERSTISELRLATHALGWNGSELVALWSGNGQISATRVTSTGVVLDREPIRVGFGDILGVPSMTCEAGQCITSWSTWNRGVEIATIVGDHAFTYSGPFRDLSDYRPRPVDRYNVAVVSKAGQFQVITSDPAGGLYTQLLRDGFVLPEIFSGSRLDGGASLVDTADGIVMISAHPVFSPGYAGARRLFLQHLPR